MDIRTRLALALVSASLLSMLALGTFAYEAASGLLREVSERQLDALAESKQRDLTKVADGWEEHVALIRSRTRLRVLLGALVSGRAVHEVESLAEIERILADALASVDRVRRISLFDFEGDFLVDVGTSEVAREFDPRVIQDPQTIHFGGTSVASDDEVIVRYSAGLLLDGRLVGAIEAMIDARDLLTITQNYTGLGETGETMVVVAGADRQALVLSPLRHDRTLRHIILEPASYLASALEGKAQIFRSGVKDYRGEDIWCATRSLTRIGWGLVVKIDSAEERARAHWLRDQMIDLGLALGAFAILAGTLLGLWLGRPIRDLKQIVERIREGESDLRAEVESQDEVGFLAEAINELLDGQGSKRS